MKHLSPKSHLYRLAAVLIVFFAAAAVARQWATPASWNYSDWYRMDALGDAAAQPMAYGGNESCVGCHKDSDQAMRKQKHKGLSCESCHGAFADHVKEDKKFAEAKVDRSRGQCVNCHGEQINRPAAFPQFSVDGEIGKFVKKHKELSEATRCIKCHDAHDPTP